jgi:hypothetical protein
MARQLLDIWGFGFAVVHWSSPCGNAGVFAFFWYVPVLLTFSSRNILFHRLIHLLGKFLKYQWIVLTNANHLCKALDFASWLPQTQTVAPHHMLFGP